MKRLFSYLLACVLFWGLTFLPGCFAPSAPPKVHRIARDVTWYPLHLMGKESSLLGFSDDLIFAVAAEKNLKIELVAAVPSSLFPGLDNGRFDAIISPALPTSVIKEDYVFSDPIFFTGPVLVVSSDTSFSNLITAKHKEIGIKSGLSATLDVQNDSGVNFMSYDDILAALENLAKGNLDGVILEAIPAHVYISSLFKGKLKIVTTPLTKEGLFMVALLDADGKEFITQFNEGLKTIKENGTYANLIKKWGLFDPEKVQE